MEKLDGRDAHAGFFAIARQGNTRNRDFCTLQFTNCTFVKDFGPYKKNQFVANITIDFSTGTIQVYNAENQDDYSWRGTLKLELI